MENSEKQDCSSELADYLQSQKEAFIASWVAQVRKDAGVPSDSLTKPEIVDHVPIIFDAIVDALRERGTEATVEQVQPFAARHTIIRWAQGYNLHAVVREVSLLRAEFIPHLRAFKDSRPSFGADAHLAASATVHRILDGIVLDATDTFLKLKTRADEDPV